MSDSLQQAKALLEKIRPGEWRAFVRDTVFGPRTYADVMRQAPGRDDWEGLSSAMSCGDEAEFIAAAPRLVRDLVAEVERLREDNAAMIDVARVAQVDVNVHSGLRERAEAEVERLREEQAAMQRALTQTAREIRSLEKRIVERDAKVAMASMRELGG